MIVSAYDKVPVLLCRFADAVDAGRAIDALLYAGIPAACMDGPTPRTSAVAIKVAGRSDRYFIAETLRELGAEVKLIEPITPK